MHGSDDQCSCSYGAGGDVGRRTPSRIDCHFRDGERRSGDSCHRLCCERHGTEELRERFAEPSSRRAMPLIEAATTGWPESCVVSATASGRIAPSLPQWAPNRREGSRAEPRFIDEARERTFAGRRGRSPRNSGFGVERSNASCATLRAFRGYTAAARDLIEVMRLGRQSAVVKGAMQVLRSDGRRRLLLLSSKSVVL